MICPLGITPFRRWLPYTRLFGSGEPVGSRLPHVCPAAMPSARKLHPNMHPLVKYGIHAYDTEIKRVPVRALWVSRSTKMAPTHAPLPEWKLNITVAHLQHSEDQPTELDRSSRVVRWGILKGHTTPICPLLSPVFL